MKLNLELNGTFFEYFNIYPVILRNIIVSLVKQTKMIELIPIDDFEKFQHKMRMKQFNNVKPVVSGKYLKPVWDEKPYSPIKSNDLPLNKFLERRKQS